MSKEFLDRLARGQLTNTRDYQRMTDALNEMKEKEEAKAPEASENQEWQTWELAPVWSSSDPKEKKADEAIRSDSVHRALGRLD